MARGGLWALLGLPDGACPLLPSRSRVQGWLQALSRIIDLALYPVLFTEYAQQYLELPAWASPLLNAVVVCISTAVRPHLCACVGSRAS